MAAFKDFEEIIAWQRAIDLAATIHAKFKDHHDFEFKDQIRGAAISVSNNIAEGFDCGSNKDFRRFLRIARSSCNEVRSMVILGDRFGYFTADEVARLREDCIRLSGMILALIKSMRTDAIRAIAPWFVPVLGWAGWL
ncbi:MAG: four helix bundle protein [Flavobacteriales bacterium]|jgi:four helix bundle protein|nr:four helix bundle protein [Flavobacteriales bacterium]